ncbi:pilus assembly protein CpaF [Lachnospiraceae bacterium C7]|nr:pilus assembly protein CpaF [Lachnospiraceae bacterium C7]
MQLGKEYFGPLWKFISDEKITDIDYNGKQIWLTNTDNERFEVEKDFLEQYITPQFIEQFTQRIANVVSRQFNKSNPELEAETPELRITIIHESVSRQGRSICIRKTPPVIRLTEEKMIESNYCTKEILKLLVNCVKGKMNFSFAGEPGVGKTECLKFFSQFIPANERVITIEDTLELRYPTTNPNKDCVEMKVDEKLFTYSDALKASLRLNPKWIMLSEARSKEVKYLLESWSTGVRGMTTLHTSDVRNIPDRILNMLENRMDADRMENDIYQALDVGILIRKKQREDGEMYRYIDQICFFIRENGENKIEMVVKNGQLLLDKLPKQVEERMKRAGISDIDVLNSRLSNNSFSSEDTIGV